MNWQQKIEAQIAELRCFQVIPGKDDYCVWEGGGKCLNCQKADAMQALLDVAVAAELWVAADDIRDSFDLAAQLEDALDKLREMDDHSPQGEDCLCPVCTGVL